MTSRYLISLLAACLSATAFAQSSWTADNGNGTFTNPLFYDEFADPDILRVGDDYYLAGTTMHSVPGLVLMHSRDLVNWDFCSYAFEEYDDTYATERNPMDVFRLKDGRNIYGQGVWAPVVRYHDGVFYLFTNVNGSGLQAYTSRDPRGPWEHHNINSRIYDLSILFDDDGKIYAFHNYGNVRVTEIKPDLSGVVEGTEHLVIRDGNAMGEGFHAYKIDGWYYLMSADYKPHGRLMVARSKSVYGPYETRVMGAEETLGTLPLPMTEGKLRPLPEDGSRIHVDFPAPDDNRGNCTVMHQGGMVSTPDGEWWAVQLMDFRGVGRTVALSPVTWEDGWPYLGLPGNLTRSPRTWFKPGLKSGSAEVKPHAAFFFSDDFNRPASMLTAYNWRRKGSFDEETWQPVPAWQWNHNPVRGQWNLKGGRLNLKSLPASQLMTAQGSLSQRLTGPVSITTVQLDGSRLKPGDVAGLGIQNIPSAWIGLMRDSEGLKVGEYDLLRSKRVTADFSGRKGTVWLRLWADLDSCKATLSYSFDNTRFTTLGDTILLSYQLHTFQGARTLLFCYNETGVKGGTASFDDFTVDQPLADRSANLPLGRKVRLFNLGDASYAAAIPHGMLYHARKASDPGTVFEVVDCGQGVVALKSDFGYLCVVGHGYVSDIHFSDRLTDDCRFMWQDMLRGDCMLLSLKTLRYVGMTPGAGESYSARWPGATANRRNGCVFRFELVE